MDSIELFDRGAEGDRQEAGKHCMEKIYSCYFF